MRTKLGLAATMLAVFAGIPAWAQKFDNYQRDQARDMLSNIAQDVRKHYYDPTLHGFDFDGRVREADEKLKKAENLGQAFRIIAWTLDGLNDSHTYFTPPPRMSRTDYGWGMQMIGNRCYVTRVRPKSDAEAKGLKPGDEILSFNGIAVTRDNFDVIYRIYHVLSPLPELRLKLRSPDGQIRELDVMAKVRQAQKQVDLTTDQGWWNYIRELEYADHMTRTRCEDMGSDLAICKMPEFNLEDEDIHRLLYRARKHKALILDLRDNPGGDEETLTRLLGGFFNHEVKIGDRVGRKPMKPEMAKSDIHVPDTKLIVLVDSDSGSSAELFARVVQLEKRGTVIGDRSSGSVMEGRFYDYQMGGDSVVPYGALITNADIIMADGQSLEKKGVTPDEVMLPTADDLRNGKDPVLAHAADLVGVKLTPEQAGKLFPFEWPKE
jgi:carboxyl-terminal processing protease